MVFDLFFTLLHVLLLLVLPPFFLGLINKTKALAAGRKGPPVLQAYYDLAKLIRRGSVFSKSSSILLRLIPLGIGACLVMAGLLLPLVGRPVFYFDGDFILFVYLLACVRFLILLAALDVGSSFGGMGASREAIFGAFSELSFMTGLIVLAIATKETSLYGILHWEGMHPTLKPAFFLIFVAFVFILLTENSRMPVDDPNTHLELTMIHEVMILDYSGPELALILYGASIKLFIFMVICASVLWPSFSFLTLFIKVTLMAILIGVIESVTARIRLKKLHGLLVINFVVTLLALLVTVFGGV